MSSTLRFYLLVSLVTLSTCLSASADSVEIENLATLHGTISPITYTTSSGTFTTGAIKLTLDHSSQSFFTFDPGTGMISVHLVMEISFKDGQGSTLVGLLTLNETGSGSLGSPILMNVTNGFLTGAGEFAGTTASGKMTCTYGNPTIWTFLDSSTTPLVFNLPPSFTNGNNIPLTGTITATVVPEPASLTLICTGAVSLLLKRRTLRRVRSATKILSLYNKPRQIPFAGKALYVDG